MKQPLPILGWDPIACVPQIPRGHGELRLFTEGDELYDTMLEAISRARMRVRLESYIFADDEVGNRFIEALHAKAAVVDHEWTIVGSSNLDYRSFGVNYEVNLVARDDLLTQQLTDTFLGDLQESEEVKLENWAARPWIYRVYETIGWLVQRWL